MKKKILLWLCACFSIIYGFTCIQLYYWLNTNVPENVLGLKLKPFDLWEGQCTCMVADLPKHRKNVYHYQDACSFFEEKHLQLDIYTPDLLSTMHLYYPKFTWTHTGWIQDYEIPYSMSEWDDEPLQIYLVPFSHADPAWRSTFETSFKKAKKILDLVLKNLLADTKLTFVWAEIIFMRRWFLELEPYRRSDFKRLLDSGRFEILTGGLVMTDESVATYPAMLDQLIEGQQLLFGLLDYEPKVSWAIDPFGLSPTMPYLLKESGIEKLLILRTHYSIKRDLAFKQRLEFEWHQTWDTTGAHALFTHMTPFLSYNIMYSCGPDMSVCCQFDFSRAHCWRGGKYVHADPITAENVKDKAWALLEQWRKKSKLFKHKMLLHMHGDDFRFADNTEWTHQIGNLSQLIDYINTHPEMHAKVKYATLGDYFSNVQQYSNAHDLEYPSLGGDFFTYTDRGQQYWSGLFSTRPFLKYMVRYMQQRLRAAEILFTLSVLRLEKLNKTLPDSGNTISSILTRQYQYLHNARETNGLMTHHDAITGTSKKTVVQDYLSRVKDAIGGLRRVIEIGQTLALMSPEKMRSEAVFQMLEEQAKYSTLPYSIPVRLPIDGSTSILLYNPLPHQRHDVISVYIEQPHVQVLEAHTSLPVRCQIAPLFQGLKIQQSRFELYFEAHMEALSVTRYIVKYVSAETKKKCTVPSVRIQSPIHLHDADSGPFAVEWERFSDATVHTDQLAVDICKCTGLIQNVHYKSLGSAYKSKITFVKYGTGSWTNPFEDKSGAYIFMPSGEAEGIEASERSTFVMQGALVSSVYTTLGLVSQRATIYNITGLSAQAVHLENWVNLAGTDNLELAMRIHTDVQEHYTPLSFYTDNNGFQMAKRSTLSRLPIQGNFYPMTTELFVEDLKNRMTLLSAQSHGVANLHQGEIDVVLDRRLNQDDWRGMSEDIIDNLRTYSRFTLLFEQSLRPPDPVRSHYTVYSSTKSHLLSLSLDNPVLVSQQTHPFEYDVSTFQPMKMPLPFDFDLLNFRTSLMGTVPANHLSDNVLKEFFNARKLLIVRRKNTECIYGMSDYKNQTVHIYDTIKGTDRIDLSNYLFKGLDILDVRLMSLSGVKEMSSEKSDTFLHIRKMEIKTIDVKFADVKK